MEKSDNTGDDKTSIILDLLTKSKSTSPEIAGALNLLQSEIPASLDSLGSGGLPVPLSAMMNSQHKKDYPWLSYNPNFFLA